MLPPIQRFTGAPATTVRSDRLGAEASTAITIGASRPSEVLRGASSISGLLEFDEGMVAAARRPGIGGSPEFPRGFRSRCGADRGRRQSSACALLAIPIEG